MYMYMHNLAQCTLQCNKFVQDQKERLNERKRDCVCILPISAAKSVTLSFGGKGGVGLVVGSCSGRPGSLKPSRVLNDVKRSGNLLYFQHTRSIQNECVSEDNLRWMLSSWCTSERVSQVALVHFSRSTLHWTKPSNEESCCTLLGFETTSESEHTYTQNNKWQGGCLTIQLYPLKSKIQVSYM